MTDAAPPDPLKKAISELPDDKRREVLKGIVAVLAGAGVLAVTTPKEAEAQFGGFDLGGLGDIFGGAMGDVMGGILGKNMFFQLPPALDAILDLLMDWLDSTAETVISDDPTDALERSWPSVPAVSDEQKRATAMFMAGATRARVTQSGGMFGAASTQQEVARTQEQTIIDTALRDPTILPKVNAALVLLGCVCRRIGQLTMTVAAHGQLAVHDAQRHAHEVANQQQVIERFLSRLEDLLAALPQSNQTMHG